MKNLRRKSNLIDISSHTYFKERAWINLVDQVRERGVITNIINYERLLKIREANYYFNLSSMKIEEYEKKLKSIQRKLEDEKKYFMNKIELLNFSNSNLNLKNIEKKDLFEILYLFVLGQKIFDYYNIFNPIFLRDALIFNGSIVALYFLAWAVTDYTLELADFYSLIYLSR